MKETVLISSIFSFLLFIPTVLAHCPLCAAATGAAVAVTRWYGVDDLIAGTFIGAFLMSTAVWMNNWLLKRHKGKEYIAFQKTIIIILTFLLMIPSFYLAGLSIDNPKFKVYGIDKIFVGSLIGSIVSLASFEFHEKLRRIHNNKNYFPFQVIVLTLVFISAANLGFYLVGWL